MTKRKDFLKITLVIFGAHIALSILFLLMYGAGHPLLRYVRDLPMVIQLLSGGLVGFILYLIPGYLIVLAYENHAKLMRHIDQAVILLALVLFIAFIVVFTVNYVAYDKSAWLFYSIVNPIFGNLMYDTLSRGLVGLFWIISTIIPSTGILFGAFLRMRTEGERQS